MAVPTGADTSARSRGYTRPARRCRGCAAARARAAGPGAARPARPGGDARRALPGRLVAAQPGADRPRPRVRALRGGGRAAPDDRRARQDACASRATSYRFPGAYLREALAAGLSRAGLARTDAVARLASGWDLGPGLTEHVLARVALDTRPGPSARGGELARLRAGADLLERAVELTATDLGVTLAPAAPRTRRARRGRRARGRRGGPGRAAARAGPGRGAPRAAGRRAGRDARGGDRPALRRPPPRALHLRLGERALGSRHRLPRRARRPPRLRRARRGDRPPRRPRAGHRRDGRLPARARAEERGLPGRRRDARAHRRRPRPPPAATRRDAPAALGDAHAAPRLARPRSRTRARPPARWSALPLRGVRPTVEIAPDGVPVVDAAADDSRPRDLILGLASGAPDAPVTAPADVAPALVAALGASLKTSPDLRERDRARHRRLAGLDRGRARQAPAARRRDASSSRPRPTRPRAGASTATSTARRPVPTPSSTSCPRTSPRSATSTRSWSGCACRGAGARGATICGWIR